jgi:hypothetical protein
MTDTLPTQQEYESFISKIINEVIVRINKDRSSDIMRKKDFTLFEKLNSYLNNYKQWYDKSYEWAKEPSFRNTKRCNLKNELLEIINKRDQSHFALQLYLDTHYPNK